MALQQETKKKKSEQDLTAPSPEKEKISFTDAMSRLGAAAGTAAAVVLAYKLEQKYGKRGGRKPSSSGGSGPKVKGNSPTPKSPDSSPPASSPSTPNTPASAPSTKKPAESKPRRVIFSNTTIKRNSAKEKSKTTTSDKNPKTKDKIPDKASQEGMVWVKKKMKDGTDGYWRKAPGK
jgi:hypothetical protein